MPTATETISDLEDIANHAMKMAKKDIAKFSERLAEDAYEAFRWMDHGLEPAAKYQLFAMVLKDIELGRDADATDNEILDEVYKGLNRIVMNAVCDIPRLPEQKLAQQAGRLLRDIKWEIN